MTVELSSSVRQRRERSALPQALRTDTAGSLLLAGGAFVVVTGLGATHGGYYPTGWGWNGVILFWLAVVGLVAPRRIRFAPAELAALVALAGFVGWVALSLLWTRSPSQTPLEIERDVVYVGALLVLLLFVRTRSLPHLLGGLLGATVAVSLYALATRLFPERADLVAGYRLAQPLGYWNALGIFVAIGTLLALGLAARGRTAPARMLAGAAVVPLVLTLYFTFSRGAWIALALGLLLACVLDPRRLQLVLAGLVLAPWCAGAVAVAWGSDALTHVGAPLAEASREGHRLVWIGAVLAAGAALSAAGLALAERRLRVAPALRGAFATLLALVLLGLLVATFARYGSPSTMARNGWHAFVAPPPRATNLNSRLFNLSSVGRELQWKSAWQEYRAHPWLGSGAGSYERWWLAHRPQGFKVRDAHSLYLEVLAELGPVGLALIALAFGIPLVAAVRARAHPLAPAAAGGYVAYLFHAGLDWDWEMPAVTIAALACGVALLKAAPHAREPLVVRPFVRALVVAVAVALSAFALVGLLGNLALASARTAAGDGRWAKEANEAQQAMMFMPWSSEPWRLRAEAAYSDGRDAAARRDLLTALAKDPDDWNLWWDIAAVDRGAQRRRAFARALALNPLSPELAQSRDWLGLGP